MYPGIISFLFFALDPLIICQTILSVKKVHLLSSIKHQNVRFAVTAVL